MASRANAARNTASKDVFEGRVRKWERGYVVHKKGTIKSETTLELLRWIPTEARCPELTGPRHPHIKPLKKPVIKQAKPPAEEGAEPGAKQTTTPSANQPSGPPPEQPAAPDDPTPQGAHAEQAPGPSGDAAIAAGAGPTEDQQQARRTAADGSGAGIAVLNEPLRAEAAESGGQGHAMEDTGEADGAQALTAEAPILNAAAGAAEFKDTAGASGGDGTRADGDDVHMTETGFGLQ